ncbi:MAG: peptide ABC transporter [Chloroflexi bacterium RBG_16_50_11]|nr:MAG: peptide ABC transporter [Chloroflexi bacterium RBG_16_50_11]
MTAYIIRRLFMAVVIIILVTVIVFLSIRLLPGDPLIIFLGNQATSGTITEEELDRLRIEYRLDKSLPEQYALWMWDLLHGNLGTSIYYHENVGTLMAERFPITLHLGVLALILNIVVGTLMGLAAAVRRGTWIDTVSTFLANIGVCIPVFWLAAILVYIFSLRLGWLEIAGYISPFEDFWLNTRQIILPVFCMAIGGLSTTARLTRSSMLEVTRQDYIRTAWSKGLRERTVIMKHALKNGLIPIVTVLGMGIGMVFAGSVIIETMFAIPGVGRLLVTSIFAQDYVVIQSGTLVIAAIIVITNLFVEISYVWLDPRIRYN